MSGPQQSKPITEQAKEAVAAAGQKAAEAWEASKETVAQVSGSRKLSERVQRPSKAPADAVWPALDALSGALCQDASNLPFALLFPLLPSFGSSITRSNPHAPSPFPPAPSQMTGTAQQKAGEAKATAGEYAEAAKQKTSEMAGVTQQRAGETTEQAKASTGGTWEATKAKAQEAGHRLGEGTQEAKHRMQEAGKEAQHRADEATRPQ